MVYCKVQVVKDINNASSDTLWRVRELSSIGGKEVQQTNF